jgi:hypothetical protein
MEVINSNFDAKKALSKLLREGCDQKAVIARVYYYCRGANPRDADSALKSGRNSLKRWRELTKRLEDDANGIERTILELAESQVMELHYPPHQHPAEVIREFAHELSIACKNLRPGLNPRSGTNETLVYLCYLVKTATAKEHYPEIAALIEAIKGPQQDRIHAADAIRNRVARYEKTYKGSCGYLREEAEDEVAEWREVRRQRAPPRQNGLLHQGKRP